MQPRAGHKLQGEEDLYPLTGGTRVGQAAAQSDLVVGGPQEVPLITFFLVFVLPPLGSML